MSFLSQEAQKRTLIDLRTDSNRAAIQHEKRVDKIVHLPNGYKPPAVHNEEEQAAARAALLDERAASLNRTVLLGEIAEKLIKEGTARTYKWLLEEKHYTRNDAVSLVRESELFMKEQVRRDIQMDYTLQVRRLEDLIDRCRLGGDHANEAKAIVALARIQGLNQRITDPKDSGFAKLMKAVSQHERNGPKVHDGNGENIPERFKTK